MSFENIPDCLVLLNPFFGKHQILLVFPATSMKYLYNALTQKFPEWDEYYKLDCIYEFLQFRVRESLLFFVEEKEGVNMIYEENFFKLNGIKYKENMCNYNLVPIMHVGMENNYFQVSMFHNQEELPPGDTKVYTIPISDEWDQMSELKKVNYWNNMICRFIKGHEYLYNGYQLETALETDPVLCTE